MTEQLDLLDFWREARGAGHRVPVLPTPDIAAVAAERDRAMEQVDAAADPAWKKYAWAWLVDYLRAHPTMFPDDLWAAGLERPREMRAFGPIIQRAARQGLIVRSGEYRPRTLGHLTDGPVWRSTIYQGER